MSGRGVVVRLPSQPGGHIGIAANKDQLEVEFGDGGVHVWSRESEAFFLLHERFPESLAHGIIGRPIETVVDHPIFRGRNYRIRQCGVADFEGGTGTTTIRIWTDRLPLLMPFSPLISELAARAGVRRRRRRG